MHHGDGRRRENVSAHKGRDNVYLEVLAVLLTLFILQSWWADNAPNTLY